MRGTRATKIGLICRIGLIGLICRKSELPDLLRCDPRSAYLAPPNFRYH